MKHLETILITNRYMKTFIPVVSLMVFMLTILLVSIFLQLLGLKPDFMLIVLGYLGTMTTAIFIKLVTVSSPVMRVTYDYED